MSAAHPYLVNILREPVVLWAVLLGLIPSALQLMAFVVFGRRSDRSQRERDQRDAADRERTDRERAARVAATKVTTATVLRTMFSGAVLVRTHVKTDVLAATLWQPRNLGTWPSPELLAEAYTASAQAAERMSTKASWAVSILGCCARAA